MPLETGTAMPPLAGATEWLNATGAHAEHETKGRVTLVHFWSASCAACRKSLPRVAALRDRRAAQGLCVIAVHTPRGGEAADAEAVRDAVSQCNVTEPCAVDNDRRLSEAFGCDEGDLPAYYLFDAEGKLRASASGEDGLGEITAALERLLPEAEGKPAS